MSYDNAYNGALFATNDSNTLAGPFQLPNVETRLRAVAHLGEGRHRLAIHAMRKDGKGLKQQPVVAGWIARANGSNPDGPVARGSLERSGKRVSLVVWKITTSDGTACYQIKPDRLNEATPSELPEL